MSYHELPIVCEAFTDIEEELPKWTRVSQRVNPPGY